MGHRSQLHTESVSVNSIVITAITVSTFPAFHIWTDEVFGVGPKLNEI